MFDLFNAVVDVVSDTAKIVTAPVQIAVDLVSVPVKEAAKVAEELVKDVKSLKD